MLPKKKTEENGKENCTKVMIILYTIFFPNSHWGNSGK